MGDVAEFSPGEVLLGKLRVVRRLGAGGIGAVYEVEHELTHHRRALKVLHPKFQADRELVERFLREASAAGRIGNPHIIECFDAGRLESGAPYILMELLQGEPLSDRVRRQGQLSEGEAVDFVLQCIDGLGAAHRAGIVHRDLKPDNLFVISQGGRDFLKVLDFGISKFDTELTGANAVTASGTAMGTPLYMPPEQMRGAKDVDARSDIYALGIILYECLSGRVPYAGESFAELAAAVLGSPPTRLESLRPDLAAALCGAVHKAFARERADRFESVEAFAAALLPFRGAARTVSGEFGATLVKATPGAVLAAEHETDEGLGATHSSSPPEPPTKPMVAEQATAPVSPAPRKSRAGLLLVALVVIGAVVKHQWDRRAPVEVVQPLLPMLVFDAGVETVDAGVATVLAADAGEVMLDAGLAVVPDAGVVRKKKVVPTGDVKSSDLEDTL